MRIRTRFSLVSMFVGVAVVSVALVVARYYYEQYHIPEAPIPWRDYRPGLVDELRAQGRPVLVHFHAQWDD